MNNTRKNLKSMSILILVLAGLHFISLVAEFIFGDTASISVPDGTSGAVVIALKVIIFALMLLPLIPQIFIGTKGLRMAARPNSSKAHIVWAIILFVFAVLSLISPVVGLIKAENILGNVSVLCGMIAEAVAYFFYAKYAKAVAK